MSELTAALGSTDDEPFPTTLGGHLAGEHRADVIPIFPVQEQQAVPVSRFRAIGASVVARASRPYGVNSTAQLLIQIRTARLLDDLRFGGPGSDTLKG